MITRRRVLVGVAVALALAIPSGAAAGGVVILVKAKIDGHDGGRPATLNAEVKKNSKGAPVLLNFIQFNWVDFQCTHPTKGPVVLDQFEIAFPAAKVKRKGKKYVYSTSEGPDRMSGSISKSGKVVTGTAHLEYEYVYDETGPDLTGYFCTSEIEYVAKSIF